MLGRLIFDVKIYLTYIKVACVLYEVEVCGLMGGECGGTGGRVPPVQREMGDVLRKYANFIVSVCISNIIVQNKIQLRFRSL